MFLSYWVWGLLCVLFGICGWVLDVRVRLCLVVRCGFCGLGVVIFFWRVGLGLFSGCFFFVGWFGFCFGGVCWIFR